MNEQSEWKKCMKIQKKRAVDRVSERDKQRERQREKRKSEREKIFFIYKIKSIFKSDIDAVFHMLGIRIIYVSVDNFEKQRIYSVQKAMILHFLEMFYPVKINLILCKDKSMSYFSQT